MQRTIPDDDEIASTGHCNSSCRDATAESLGRLEGRLGIDFAGLLGDRQGKLRFRKLELDADLATLVLITSIALLGALS